MPQKTSPFLEGKWGWNLGEGSWNTGADENWLKFSYMFDRNVDGIVSSLPPAVNGQAYFNTVDNRFYFVVDGTYYSSPCPKWFVFVVRTTGEQYQFDGSVAVQIPTVSSINSRLTTAENELEVLLNQTYDTMAQLLAATVPITVNSIYLRGYHTPNDGGAQALIRIATPSTIKPWHKQSADGAWWLIKADRITIVMFGGKRTYAFDSRPALIDALEYAQTFNASFDEIGVYGIVGSIEVSDRPIAFKGRGAVAKMHYQTFDDKRWLRRGTDTDGILFKDKIPGATLIFKNGGPVTTYNLTNRTDDYATVKPCICLKSNSNELINFAVVQDNDCFDEDGNYTPLYDQNTATDYDMGIFNMDSPRNLQQDMTVWGYFDKSGTTIWSQPGNDDPDGNIIDRGMYSGRHGISLLGASSPSSQSQGLSGTMIYGTTIGSKDNNSRVANVGGLTVADYYVNADAEKWRCLYIDGDVSVNTVDLAGQFFSSVIFRSAINYPVELGYCSSVKFLAGILESGNYGVPGSNTTKWLANLNTGPGVVIDEMRVAELGAFFHPEFAGRIPFRISGGIAGNASAIYSKVNPNVAGGFSAMKVGIGRGVGDVGIQFTSDLASENNGFAFGYDISEDTIRLWHTGVEIFSATPQGVFVPKLTAPQAGAVLTISSGSITPTTYQHVINGEGGVADDLVNIAAGVSDRQILDLRIGNATITVKNGTGNIRCGSDRVLSSSLDRISLEWAAGSALWVMRSFADNG